MRIWEKAPAKINLTLDVIGKRDDGYHEVEMIMTTVDLSDRLSFQSLEGDQIILESNSGIVPNDERNLVYRAAQLVKKEYNLKKGVHIYLEKNIPVAAGLAGGSSDAAATLRGLNRLWRLGLSTEQLLVLGEKIGSDVPFCILGGTALATGRGEKLEPIASPPSAWVILAKLPMGVSTSDVYGGLNLDNVIKHPDTKMMITALEDKNYPLMTHLLSNVLEEVTFELYPKVKQLKEQMKLFGADGVLMSGSGPTVYAIVNKESKVKRIYNALRGFCKEVYAVRILGRNV